MTQESVPNPDVLAHWHFNAEQWREFRYYEKLDFQNRSSLDEKTVLIGGGIIVVILAIGASFVPNRLGHPGSLAASLLVLILGFAFLGGCFLIYRLVRKNAENKLNTETGQVMITMKLANVNGVVFTWGSGWSWASISESYIPIGDKQMLLLRFKCSRWISVRGSRERIEKTGLVPVPIGKEAEARAAVARINEKWPLKD